MAAQVHRLEGGDAARLQDVLDAAQAGDVIALGPGEYPGPFAVRQTLSIVAREAREGVARSDGAPGDRPILVGGDAGRVLSIEGQGVTVTLSGLTIRGGSTGLGAGVGLMGMGELEAFGCVFEDNRATEVGGGALYATAGRIQLRDCVFRRNHGGRGGALLLGDVALAAATNCVFEANTATRGGAVRLEGRPLFAALHCTFADNRAAERGGTFDLAGARRDRPQLRLANSLVLAGAGSLGDEAGSPGRVVVAWSVAPPDWREAPSRLESEGETLFTAAERGTRGGFPTVAPEGAGAGGADWTLTLCGDALLDLTGTHRLSDERIDVGAVDAAE